MHKFDAWSVHFNFNSQHQSLHMIKFLGGSEEKMVCLCISKISCCYLIITWMLTYIRVSKNIQKKIKFGWKIRIQHGPDKQDSSKKKCVLMKMLSKLLYLFYNTRVLYSDRGEIPLWSECLPLLIRDSRYLVFCCHSVISLFTALYFSKNSTCKFNTTAAKAWDQ